MDIVCCVNKAERNYPTKKKYLHLSQFPDEIFILYRKLKRYVENPSPEPFMEVLQNIHLYTN